MTTGMITKELFLRCSGAIVNQGQCCPAALASWPPPWAPITRPASTLRSVSGGGLVPGLAPLRSSPSLGKAWLHASATSRSDPRHGTTIVCVRKNGYVCMMGDGMVSQGNMIIKPNANKLRRILPKGSPERPPTTSSEESASSSEPLPGGTLVGFAGSTADAFTLLERLEGKLDEYPGQLTRACVELAKGWRTDKYLRRLEASLIVADASVSLELTGNGDVLESHDGILAVGSGSPYAMAAARALMDFPELAAEEVARKAMNIAADMCIYTNKEFKIELLKAVAAEEGEGASQI